MAPPDSEMKPSSFSAIAMDEVPVHVNLAEQRGNAKGNQQNMWPFPRRKKIQKRSLTPTSALRYKRFP